MLLVTIGLLMSAKERNKSRRSTMRYFVSKAGWMSFLAANEDEAQELQRANEDEDQELQTTANEDEDEGPELQRAIAMSMGAGRY